MTDYVFKIRETKPKPEPDKPVEVEVWLEQNSNGTVDLNAELNGLSKNIIRLSHKGIRRYKSAGRVGIPTNAEGQVLIEGLKEAE